MVVCHCGVLLWRGFYTIEACDPGPEIQSALTVDDYFEIRSQTNSRNAISAYAPNIVTVRSVKELPFKLVIRRTWSVFTAFGIEQTSIW